MTFDFRAYKREWMRRKRARLHIIVVMKRKEMKLAEGFCPECEIRLDSRFHTDCPFLHTQVGRHLDTQNL